MKFVKDYLRLYAVTPEFVNADSDIFRKIESALASGVTALQLREKKLTGDALLTIALRLKKLCRKYHIPLIINDNPELAKECRADGLHLGQDDAAINYSRKIIGDEIFIGISAHSVAEAVAAECAGADYLGVGAMFTTETKSDAKPLSRVTLMEITRSVGIPVVAIGGIDRHNIADLAGTNIAGVAVVSAIFNSTDATAATRELLRLADTL